jgi:hypothetical protein
MAIKKKGGLEGRITKCLEIPGNEAREVEPYTGHPAPRRSAINNLSYTSRLSGFSGKLAFILIIRRDL